MAMWDVKLPKSKPATKIPSREEIYSKISEFRDFDLKTKQCIQVYSYIFENGLHARTEVRIDADKVDTTYHARESTKAINKLIDMVLDQYNDGLPFDYLKYIKAAMPITDFCVSKRKDADNWIEGLPAIKKIETYNDRVVKVTFIDDTFTKSVCSENDHFDLDVGITICSMKRLLGKDGNRHYNDLIRKAHKVIIENDRKKEAEAKEKAEKKIKAKKAACKKATKKLLAKQEQIDIQTQAIIQAHEELEARAREA